MNDCNILRCQKATTFGGSPSTFNLHENLRETSGLDLGEKRIGDATLNY